MQIYLEKFNSTKEVVNYGGILTRLNAMTRVFLFFGDPLIFRKFLIKAVELDMMKGEHIYIITTPFRFNTDPGYLTWQKGDLDDQTVRLAYRSVFIIEPHNTVYGSTNGSDKFSLEMKDLTKREYNYTYKPFELISPHPASAYAGILMIAQVINELLVSKSFKSLESGREIAKRFWSRAFYTDVGTFYIDQVGERIPTVMVNQLDWNTSQIRTVFIQNSATLTLEIINEPQWPGVWPPRNVPVCGFRGDSLACAFKGHTDLYAGSIAGIAVVILLAVSLGIVISRRLAYDKLLKDTLWIVDPCLLRYADTNQPFSSPLPSDTKSRKLLKYSDDQLVWMSYGSTLESPMARTRGYLCEAAITYLSHILRLDHPNINRFIGLCWLNNVVHFVYNYVSRGSLTDLTHQITLDYDLQIALIFDVLRGVKAIHRSQVKYHGALTSCCCFVDEHFTLKIGEAGFIKLRKRMRPLKSTKRPVDSQTSRTVETNRKGSDVKAVGMVLLHIITLDDPFAYTAENSPKLNPEKIKTSTISTKLLELLPVIRTCTDDPPEIATVIQSATQALGVKHNYAEESHLFERILNRLEDYTAELDRQVGARTTALLNERRKCDALLREMLPSKVIELLRKGITPAPEAFDSATIMFTEIGGFQGIVRSCKPVSVMTFLNDVYTAFDTIVSCFDVYKVETIKDSYMVVSGIPTRNGNCHAKEICSLAIALVKSYSGFEALHDGQTALRAGVHTGSCAAGVVGNKVPRYCLFGDTVNTASRMLMYSFDSRVHISENTARLLMLHYSEFKLLQRGELEVKGKGAVRTYWLLIEEI
ncbi:atrial natriuretic peptide receptor 1-like isoform X2 [Paramacrobiotus metropolitanus]|uniref:atrial natriuretic peptide receptor 1-like isoform X2 n=2 Tax=Paramacrobiotus metropolitanus TaxID=2943436 RepID=UPI002445FC74|nr:atrial natriuretic peptide receptor 1-like isoform X2 [Paramacrobiotus metropolitanus]